MQLLKLSIRAVRQVQAPNLPIRTVRQMQAPNLPIRTVRQVQAPNPPIKAPNLTIRAVRQVRPPTVQWMGTFSTIMNSSKTLLYLPTSFLMQYLGSNSERCGGPSYVADFLCAVYRQIQGFNPAIFYFLEGIAPLCGKYTRVLLV